MKIVIFLLMLNTLYGVHFSESQHSVLSHAKQYGKYYDLDESLPAIVLQESSAGEQRENYLSGCFGIGHIRLRTYLDRHNIKRTYSNQVKYKELLTNNDNINLAAMVEELLFWLKVHKGNHTKAYASYFAGYDVKAGLAYARDIRKNMKLLRKMRI